MQESANDAADARRHPGEDFSASWPRIMDSDLTRGAAQPVPTQQSHPGSPMTPSSWLLVAMVIIALWIVAAVLAVALCRAAARRRPPAQIHRQEMGADGADASCAE